MKSEKNNIKFYQRDSIEIIEGEGNISIPYHTQHCFMVGVITGGFAKIKIKDCEYSLGRGMVYIVPPNTGISMNYITKFSYTNVCIKSPWAQRMNEYQIEGFVKRDMKISVTELCERYKVNGETEQFLNAMIHSLNLKHGLVANCSHHTPNLLIEKAVKYINEHICEKCSIEDIAKQLFVSKYYFCRLFKKEMGITPKQYVLQTKLGMVKRKIWENETETKIAEDLEFAAQSHMCSLFKKYMGLSIREYKHNLTIK